MIIGYLIWDVSHIFYMFFTVYWNIWRLQLHWLYQFVGNPSKPSSSFLLFSGANPWSIFEDCSRIPRREHYVTLHNLGEFMKESLSDWRFWDATHGLYFHYIIIQLIIRLGTRDTCRNLLPPGPWSKVSNPGILPQVSQLCGFFFQVSSVPRPLFGGARIDQLCLSCLRTVRLTLRPIHICMATPPSTVFRLGPLGGSTMLDFDAVHVKSAIVTTGWCDLLQVSICRVYFFLCFSDNMSCVFG